MRYLIDRFNCFLGKHTVRNFGDCACRLITVAPVDPNSLFICPRITVNKSNPPKFRVFFEPGIVCQGADVRVKE